MILFCLHTHLSKVTLKAVGKFKAINLNDKKTNGKKLFSLDERKTDQLKCSSFTFFFKF